MTPTAVFKRLRTLALRYPEATEDHPWGETAIKVRGKVFLFLHADEKDVGMSVKLPQSKELAFSFDFTEPTGYGLGKSGWVSARFKPGADVPLEHLEAWVDESYRAVAPKKLVKALDE